MNPLIRVKAITSALLSFAKTGMRFATSRFLVATIILTAVATSAHSRTIVTADGYVLKVNGSPFVIKGMNYSPVPIGTKPEFIPYGDYFIPFYANVWRPDLDKIREAGVNVIKLYAGNPDLNAGNPGTAGNWRQFLDYCYNGGNKPVYVVMFSFTLGGEIERGGPEFEKYKRQVPKTRKEHRPTSSGFRLHDWQ